MTTGGPDRPDPFLPEQRERVNALKVARSLLVEQRFGGSSRITSIVDLITLAQWILDGHDPWPVDQSDESKVAIRDYHGNLVMEVPDELRDEPADESIQADR